MSASELSSLYHRGQYGAIEETSSSLLHEDGAEHSSGSSLRLGVLDSSEELQRDRGSGWVGAAFNLTSSIVGAGCIGLGGAIANSGGLVSFLAICLFAVLSKFSFDLVVDLAIESRDTATSTYESLGFATYGKAGKMTVVISKGLYSFGCLVAYIIIVKDNLAFAISHLLYGVNNNGDDGSTQMTTMESILKSEHIVTCFFCSAVMLPLCMLRDLTPLERFSAVKIVAMMIIVLIVIFLFAVSEKNENDFVEHWLVIQGGVFESLGTFVFTFVAQHAIHLVYQSLKNSERKNFSKTTTLGTILSTLVSMLMGFFVYMTFWENASSSFFSLYPPSKAVDICRILLCVSMLLTYPFPFFTVRELLVLLCCVGTRHGNSQLPSNDSTKPLLRMELVGEHNSWLLPGDERQLKRKYHVALTTFIWLVTLMLALRASSLGAVLNLTGCVCGTVISYILPAMFSFKLRGHTVLGSLLFLLGGSVGIVGTCYSVIAMF